MQTSNLTRRFVTCTLAIYFAFSLIFFASVTLTGALPAGSGMIIAALLFFLTAPSTLLATLRYIRRPDPKDGLVATRVAFRKAGYINGAFAGFIIGAHYWGNVGGVAAMIVLVLAGWYAGDTIANYIWPRLSPPSTNAV
jgi:hypothetical protein